MVHSITLEEVRAQCAAAGLPVVRFSSTGAAVIVPSATVAGEEYVVIPVSPGRGHCSCLHGVERAALNLLAYCWHVRTAWSFQRTHQQPAVNVPVVAQAVAAAGTPAPFADLVAEIFPAAPVYTRRERRKEAW